MNNYKNHIFQHLRITEEVKSNNSFDEEFFELKKILEIIRNQDEEFIFFVSLAASKILDYNKAEHYYSLIFLNEILNENLNEKEFIKIWQNLFNIFTNKLEFKHIFDKEENLFEILFFNHFFNLIIHRFCHLIEIEDYIQLLSIYSEIENLEILFYFMENNDFLHINSGCYLESDDKNIFFSYNKNSKYNPKKNSLELNKYNKLIKRDISVELNILLIYKLINYFSQNFQNQKSELSIEKLKDSFKFLYRIISNITNFNDITLDTLSYLHNIFKLLQENNFICFYISYKPDYDESFYRVVNEIIPKLIISLPNIDDQKWHFFLSIMNTLINTLLLEDEITQKKSFVYLTKLFSYIKIPPMILKEVLNILASYFNGMRLCNFKHSNFWIDLFNIFNYLFVYNEEMINNEKEMDRLWQIYIKGFMDNYRQNKKQGDDLTDINTKSIIRDTLNFVYSRGKLLF